MYFLLRNDSTYQFYGNLTILCQTENKQGLSYSTLSKHFSDSDYFEGNGIKIWKGEPKRSNRK